MEFFLKEFVMFIGSGKGLWFLWALIYTIYVILKRKRLLYMLWILFPIIPIAHFFINKQTKAIWIFFAMFSIGHLSFMFFLEPIVAGKRVTEITFQYNNQQYTINRKTDVELITDIKWDIYKNEILLGLGIKEMKDATNEIGDINIVIGRRVIVYPYNIKKIVQKIKYLNE